MNNKHRDAFQIKSDARHAREQLVPENKKYNLHPERRTCNFCAIKAVYCGVKRALNGMQIKRCSKLIIKGEN